MEYILGPSKAKKKINVLVFFPRNRHYIVLAGHSENQLNCTHTLFANFSFPTILYYTWYKYNYSTKHGIIWVSLCGRGGFLTLLRESPNQGIFLGNQVLLPMSYSQQNWTVHWKDRRMEREGGRKRNIQKEIEERERRRGRRKGRKGDREKETGKESDNERTDERGREKKT